MQINWDKPFTGEWAIMTLDGRTLKQGAVNAENLLPLQTSDLSSGLYFLKIWNKNQTETHKVVVGN